MVLVPSTGKKPNWVSKPQGTEINQESKRQPKITHTRYIGLVVLAHVIKGFNFFSSIGIFFFMWSRGM